MAVRGLVRSVHRIRLRTIMRSATLIALVATAAMWARSYRTVNGADLYVWSTKQGVYLSPGIWTDRGLLSVIWENAGNPTGPDGILRDGRPAFRFLVSSRPVYPQGSPAYSATRRTWRDYWFKFEPIERGDGVMGDWDLDIPFWAIAAALAAYWLPATFRSLRRRSRERRGRCTHCGYDLRGSPSRCPECGAEAAQNRTPAEGAGKQVGT